MDAVILGGGLSGLVCALELQRRGVSVSIVEQAATPGGLARTLEHDGYRFDLGGHRFHSNNPEVVAWLEDLLPDDLVVVQRQSRIRLAGDFGLRSGSAFPVSGARSARCCSRGRKGWPPPQPSSSTPAAASA